MIKDVHINNSRVRFSGAIEFRAYTALSPTAGASAKLLDCWRGLWLENRILPPYFRGQNLWERARSGNSWALRSVVGPRAAYPSLRYSGEFHSYAESR